MTSSGDMAPPPGGGDSHSDALIIGGGFAGLLTALALAADGARVTVIERDRAAATPAPRPGTPQGRFVHQLLARGLELIGSLVPQLEPSLRAAGAVAIDWHKDVHWLSAAGWMPRSQQYALRTISCSRELLEHLVREHVRRHSSIRFHEGCEVRSLLVAGTRVTGAEIGAHGGGGGGAALRLQAGLVIDASGRNGHTLDWLAAAGVRDIDEAVVDARLGYASAVVRARPDHITDGAALIVHPQPPHNMRSGTIFPIEGERWIVTLTGVGGDFPPVDVAGFLAFARSLRIPALHDAVAGATDLAGVRGFRNTANRFRRLERIADWPQGFVVVGDAVCAFNPVYGQGMTVAATTAFAVRSWFQHGGAASRTAELQRDVAGLFHTAWTMATSTDRGYPTTTCIGLESEPVSTQVAGMIRAATGDPAAYHRWLRVMHMLDSLPQRGDPGLEASPRDHADRSSVGDVASPR